MQRASLKIQMEVHVPQAGDQKLSSGVDDLRANARAGRGLHAEAYGNNTPATDSDRDILARRRAGSIDNRGMLDDDILSDDILSKDGWKEYSESEQPAGEQTILTCLFQISCSVSD